MKRFLSLLFIAGTIAAQDAVISVDVSRVLLHITVREGKARFISDLTKDAFAVKEDGVPQQIVSFSREDVPIAIGLLIDNSQSMMNKKQEVIAAAQAFVRASKPDDEIFVLHFNEELTYGLPQNVPFTGDAALLEKAIASVRLDGRTALYDAIREGLKHLETSKLTKKALFVISDGGDNQSATKASDVVSLADRSGALFYAIGVYDPMDGDADPGVLRRLAKNTGGEAYFPKAIDEVKTLCETVARDLRNQYMISYAPTRPAADDKYHRVEVKVKDPQNRKLVVRTRTGYYAETAKPEGTPK
jgi:VWFA-related protein